MGDETKVSILMDNAAAAADMERMANAWERAAAAQERAAQAAGRMTGSSPPPLPGAMPVAPGAGMGTLNSMAGGAQGGMGGMFHAPMGGMGMSGAMGAAGSALGIYAAGHAMSSVASAMSRLGDSTKMFDERMVAAAESLPIVGTLVRGFRDLAEAAKGTADAMRRQAMASEYESGVSPARQSFAFEHAGMRAQAYGMRQTAGYWRGQANAGFAGLGVADPRNLYDPYQAGAFGRQIGLAQSRQGIQAGIVETEARGQGLDHQRLMLLGMRDTARDRQKKAMQEEQQARAGAHYLGSSLFGSSKATVDKSAREQLQLSRDLLAIEQKIKENTESRQQNAMELERKRGELVGHAIAVEKERLSVLKEQEGIVRAQTQSWGRATGAERQVATAWARQAQKDPNSLARGQWDYLQRFAPNMVARHMERKGEADPGLREFQQLTGTLNNTPQGLGDNLRQQQEVQKNLADLANKMQAQVAEGSLKEFTKALDSFIDSMNRIIDAKAKAITNGQIIRNNGG